MQAGKVLSRRDVEQFRAADVWTIAELHPGKGAFLHRSYVTLDCCVYGTIILYVLDQHVTHRCSTHSTWVNGCCHQSRVDPVFVCDSVILCHLRTLREKFCKELRMTLSSSSLFRSTMLCAQHRELYRKTHVLQTAASFCFLSLCVSLLDPERKPCALSCTAQSWTQRNNTMYR